jgi:hypothetical protein
MSTSTSTDSAQPLAVIADPLPLPPPIETPTTSSAPTAKEVVVVDLSEETTVKSAEVVQVVHLTEEQPPPKTLKFLEPFGLPALPPPSSYPPFPWPRVPMAALPPPIVYHDRAYNAIQFPGRL